MRFFEKIFLLTNTNIEVVLGMFFFFFSSADFQFDTKKLTWKSYTTEEILPITKKIEFIDEYKFAKVALVMHVVVLDILMRIYPN